MIKKLLLGLIGLSVISSLSSCGYNTMVKQDENVQSKWAQVENAYQRRADLIPNLVNTVMGAADFEKETLREVVDARGRATSVVIDADNLSPEAIQEFQEAQGALSASLGRLLATVEAYPDLKANKNFLQMQEQLEGTENRISVERRAFNEATQQYNSTVRSFPTNVMAGIFGFKQKGYFQADKGAAEVPKVSF